MDITQQAELEASSSDSSGSSDRGGERAQRLGEQLLTKHASTLLPRVGVIVVMRRMTGTVIMCLAVWIPTMSHRHASQRATLDTEAGCGDRLGYPSRSAEHTSESEDELGYSEEEEEGGLEDDMEDDGEGRVTATTTFITLVTKAMKTRRCW